MRNKVICLIVFLFMIAVSLPGGATDIKEKTIIKGNYTTITINREIKKNHKWEYEVEHNNIIEVVSKSYSKQLKTGEGNVINDIHTWYIKALSTGSTNLKFNVVDSSGQPVKRKLINYKIKVLPKRIKVRPNNLIKLELKENRTTGYTWHLKIEDDNIVKVHHDDFIEPKLDPNKAGQPGIHYWYIKGINKGETKLTFKLCRNWNKEQFKVKKEYIINVSR